MGAEVNRDQDEEQKKFVDAWIEQNLKGLPADQQLRLFAAAVLALQKRILVTLSEITLNAVQSRVLYQSQQKYPIFSMIKIEPNVVLLDELRSMLSEERNQDTDFTEAFRFFLIELFTILENLTAGILIKPLREELAQVKAESQSAEDGDDVCQEDR